MGSLESASRQHDCFSLSPTMRLLFVLLLLATISLALGGLVRREADPEADADPHRRHGHHHRHHSSSYYRPSYSSNYQGYNNYNNYNNNNYRPNTPIRDLLPLKAAALAGAVGGFKVASILG